MRLPLSRKHVPLLSTAAVCVLLYAIAAARYPHFLSLEVFLNFFRNNAPLGIVAVGMTFVILSGGIDLSVGSVAALSGILMAVMMDGPAAFDPGDIRDLPALVARLKAGDDPLSRHLYSSLAPATRRCIETSDFSSPAEADRLRAALARDIDELLPSQVMLAHPGMSADADARRVQLAADRGWREPYHAEWRRGVGRRERAGLNHWLIREAYPELLRDSKMKHPCLPIPLVFALVLVAGTAFGLGMGCTIRYLGLPPFIATLAGMFLARGLGFVTSLSSLTIHDPFFQAASGWAVEVGDARVPLATLAFLAVLAVGVYGATWTRFGRNVYALGGNEEAALLMGVPVGRTKLLVYALSGFCAALAGVVSTLSKSSGDPRAAFGMELDAIAAVVIGGTLLTGGVGHVFGTLLGLLIFGIIDEGIRSEGTLSSSWTRVAVGGLLLLFILLQKLVARTGLRGAR